MKIKRLVVHAADTSKKDYVVKVKKLLSQHDHQAQQPYIKRATELFEKNSDSESLLPILLSA